MGQPPCTHGDDTTLLVDGKACDGCSVDFGDVDIPLQEHRRIDIQLGCDDSLFDVPTVSGDGFSIDDPNNFVFPGPGQTTFSEVTFTAGTAGDADGTFTVSTARSEGGLTLALHATAVSP